MNYLTGTDYPYLCERCRALIDAATTEVVGELVPAEYVRDPEGPIMLVGDRGHLRMCETCNPPDEPEPEIDYSRPQWSFFFVWYNTREKELLVIPACSCFEDWPVKGGAFTEMGQALGWDMAADSLSPVGGYYLHPTEDVALECLEFGRWPEALDTWTISSPVPGLFDIGALPWE